MIDMQRREADTQSTESTPGWADAIRRGRHPRSANPAEVTAWRAPAVDRLGRLLAVDTERSDGRLIIDGVGERQVITLLTGRPVLGHRVADTMAAVRALRTVEGVDPTKVAVIGGSGGGAVALITAALDDQIPAAVVAAFLSSFVDSFCAVPHCLCNAVPDLLTWFEMADVAALIAPRGLVIEAGRQDPIFPIGATETAYAELVDVWRGLAAEPPELVITDAGHQFRADEAIALLRRHLLATP
jgi:hypothetical protein